jgi:hypothetical protein
MSVVNLEVGFLGSSQPNVDCTTELAVEDY